MAATVVVVSSTSEANLPGKMKEIKSALFVTDDFCSLQRTEVSEIKGQMNEKESNNQKKWQGKFTIFQMFESPERPNI